MALWHQVGLYWQTLRHLRPVQFYGRVAHGPAVALLDVALVGPDYLPGHAHADTLSFELSVGTQRVLVNSGTSCYGSTPERLRQRGTAAHNTVVVNGEDSSEVWGGFRVARRAYPLGLNIQQSADATATEVRCAHNGYIETAFGSRKPWPASGSSGCGPTSLPTKVFPSAPWTT